MSEFSLIVYGAQPAINRTYKIVHVRNKAGDPVQRLAKESSVSAWQDEVAYLVRSAKPKGWTASRRVRVEVSWWAPRKRDADAGLKALLDGLAVGLGVDDSCFLPSVLLNEVDKEVPRTYVTIRTEGETT